MIELALLVPTLILGYLLWREGRDRATERAEWAHERQELLAGAEAERKGLIDAAERERRSLLNRIQAPDKAVIEDFEPSDIKQYVPFDDDEAWAANQEELNG